MNKILSLFIIIVCFKIIPVNGQTRKPLKIKKTQANYKNECLMPIFEIQDASDRCDSLHSTNDVIEIARLLKEIKINLDWFEIFSDDCSCLKKYEDEFFLYLPDDKIANALKLDNIFQISKLVIEIKKDIDFIWMLSSDCY